MKTVMRSLTLLLALALLLCVAGCKKKEAAAGAAAPKTTTQAAQESEVTAPAEETATEAAASTDTAETTEATASAPAQTQEQPVGQELEYDESIAVEEEFLDEQIGIGPRITVKWETYENMSDAEREAYRACFTNDYAFGEWEDMAMLDFDSYYDEPVFLGSDTLSLKEIVESLTGKTFE